MIPNGTYPARLRGQVIIYLAGKDEDNLPQRALMGFLPMTITDGEQKGQNIDATQCFIAKDGTIMTRTIETMQEVFGMQGGNPYWMQFLNPDDASDSRPRDLTGIDISIVVEAEEYNGKTSAKVKWINKPGGGSWTPKTADRGAIISKYGSQFRALAGGSPAKPAAQKNPPPAPKKTPPVPQTGPTATMEEAWEALCQNNPNLDQDGATKLWQTVIEKNYPGKTNSDLTPHDWGKLKEIFSDNVPQ